VSAEQREYFAIELAPLKVLEGKVTARVFDTQFWRLLGECARSRRGRMICLRSR
jgi:hypothetical protein